MHAANLSSNACPKYFLLTHPMKLSLNKTQISTRKCMLQVLILKCTLQIFILKCLL